MSTVTLADAKARLSHLLDQVVAGGEVVITRRGRPIARISPVDKPKGSLKPRSEFRGRMPHWRKPSARLLRELRNEDR